MQNTWDIDNLTIRSGYHSPPNGEVHVCAMEAAYLRWALRQGWPRQQIVAGWTDRLDCVCPYIGSFVRSWNDSISDDATRTRIFTPEVLDLLPGTRSDEATMLRRMWMAIDWAIRVHVPAFLRAAKLDAEASSLEALPEIVSTKRLSEAHALVTRVATRASAARAAAGYALVDAARAAVGSAAWDAAWDAVVNAVRSAARAAALAAAGAAARDALAPTVEALQVSAVDLLKRMCAIKAANGEP
jgi:hypothetical protein